MTLKWVGLVVATLSVSPVFASFELGLTVGSENAGTFVRRYDVENGVYLGAFQVGSDTPYDISGSSATGLCYTTGASKISAWNFSTGSYLGSVSDTLGIYASSISIDQTRLLTVGGAVGVKSYNSTLTSSNTPYLFGSQSFTHITTNGTDTVMAFDSSTGRIVAWNNAGTQLGTAVLPTLGSFTRSLAIVRGGTNGNWKVVMYQGGLLRVTDYNPVSHVFGATTTQSLFFVSTAYYVNAGHYGANIVGYDSVTSTYRNVRTDGDLTGYSYMTLQSNPYDMTVVLAPEPGSMSVLGLGLVAILRKRNRK